MSRLSFAVVEIIKINALPLRQVFNSFIAHLILMSWVSLRYATEGIHVRSGVLFVIKKPAGVWRMSCKNLRCISLTCRCLIAA